MEYKNILWIDDCDDNDAGNIDSDPLEDELNGTEADDTEIISDYFGDAYADVKLIKEFTSAINELDKNSNKYDLVVFDMNMKNGMQSEQFGNIRQLLKENRVIVREEKWNEFYENAGIYLYLYLLNKGYPNNRMVIMTGNGTKSPEERLKSACISVDDSNLLSKKGGTIGENKGWISKYYNDEYYLVRRMVFKACEYWKDHLEKTKDYQMIAFNLLYYENNPDIVITNEMFANMLDRIELLFPVIKPYDVGGVYYQALQVLTMYHEESAKIDKLKKFPNIKKYHQSARNFRNWSAHNKLSSTKIGADIFIYIFCITLRTYFEKVTSDKSDQIQTGEEWYEIYEKEALQAIMIENLDYLAYETYYKADWQRHLKKIMRSANRKLWQCDDMNTLLLESGNCANKDSDGMEIVDCIINILEEHINRKDDFQDQGTGFLFSLEYEWKCDRTVDVQLYENLIKRKLDSFDELAVLLYLKLKG